MTADPTKRGAATKVHIETLTPDELRKGLAVVPAWIETVLERTREAGRKVEYETLLTPFGTYPITVRVSDERDEAMTELQPILRDDVIYLGDNGRCFCGRLHHAGMTAHFTGRDRSGHRVHEVTEADQREARRMGVTLACETCRVEPRR